MSSTLASQVEEFINEAGRVPRTDVYRRFDLVGKRFVDQALVELGEGGRVVVGASDVAPVRKSRRLTEVAVFGDGAEGLTEESIAEPAESGKGWEMCLPDRLVRLLRAGGQMHLSCIAAALKPPARRKDVASALSRLKARGVVANPAHGRWEVLNADKPLHGPAMRNGILAVFEPGKVLSRADLAVLLPQYKGQSLSTELCRLVKAGRLVNKRATGYWLPDTAAEQ